MFIRPFLLLFSLCLFNHLASSIGTACHDSESSALLQFKNSFLIRKFASSVPSAYPKVQQWKLDKEGNGDCCAWHGVECNNNTGHVIGLDLSSSFLYGSIHSNSSLFRLVHLRRLNLSDNDFNHSKIPSGIANLSRLSHLDLSFSVFSGQIPSQVFKLSHLVILDLSGNELELQRPEARNLDEKLTNLKELHLSEVNISSTVSQNLGNLSSLTSLSMEDCSLHGELPATIFQLPNLRLLSLQDNPYLTGKLPEFNRSSLIEVLKLANTSFSGPLPSSLGELTKLKYLRLSYNQFSGKIPSSLANLTQLNYLSLSFNSFSPGTLSWLGKQTRLTQLSLAQANLYGEIPSSLGNLTHLAHTDLGYNKLQGQIPKSIFNLVNLQGLYLDSNDLNGTLKFESFVNLKNLIDLQLSQNNLSVLTKITINGTVPKYLNLDLGDCNLLEFPEFLHEQDELEMLYLSRNKIHGQIPKWVWEMSKESLSVLDLSGNFLTGFDKTTSPLQCNLSSLAFLDLSNNNLSSTFPQCLTNLSESLEVLDLRNNNFVGSIPQLCTKGSQLRMIDLNQNQFQGQLPRSLANCDKVEILDIGNNQLYDTFPFWLGKLPELKILLLRGNQLHGTIEEERENFEFSKLQIIDLSFNRFTGKLPSQQFQNWSAMKVVDATHLSYLQAKSVFGSQNFSWDYSFPYSMTLTSKGTDTNYEKIQDFLIAIDFSSNRFEGCIPWNIGNLKALRLLNLSNNALSCHIPTSLGNLSNLESLDLSHNNLSGEIPTELLQLTFLGFFNVSNNNLTGQIPQGKQFATFENKSFGSNPGLCGKPLSKACKISQVSPPPLSSEEDQGQEPLLEFDLKIILIGFGGGLLNGLAIGYIYTPKWFMKYLRSMQQKSRETRKRRN
ncbi:hypothetical protein PTKIN_Ptkin15bG0155900 [Pterospermum kingtungense]